MSNISAGALTFCVYIGNTPGRLIGTPQPGEIDLRTTFTTVNTDRIYSIDPTTKALRTAIPGSNFSQFSTLEPLSSYAIKGRTNFAFENILPYSDATRNSVILSGIRAAIEGTSSATYNTTITIVTNSVFVTVEEITLNALAGDELKFNVISSGPETFMQMILLVGTTAVAQIDFPSRYLGQRFSFKRNATSITYNQPNYVFAEGEVTLT